MEHRPAPFDPQRAADVLWKAWQSGDGLSALPDDCRPTSVADGFAIQSLFERHSAGPLFGWKIAATSVAGQQHIGVGGPLAGRLLPERVVPAGATLSLAGNRMAVAEPEFAFRMGDTLAARGQPYAVDEVMAAVASLHPAIEIPSSRFADFVHAGEAQLVADNACAHQFMLGDAAPDIWRGIDLVAHPVHATVDGPSRRYERSGSGKAVLGDPRVALAWLVNALIGLGTELRAGQVVTTGACMTPLEVEAGDHVVADYGALGSISIRFSA